MLIAMFVFGVIVGWFIGDNWRYWWHEFTEWFIAISAAVGIIGTIVVAVAWGGGWRPW